MPVLAVNCLIATSVCDVVVQVVLTGILVGLGTVSVVAWLVMLNMMVCLLVMGRLLSLISWVWSLLVTPWAVPTGILP